MSSWRGAPKGSDAAQWLLAMRTEDDDGPEGGWPGRRRGRIQQHGHFLEVPLGGGTEPAEVAHTMKPFGQHMLEETAQELFAA